MSGCLVMQDNEGKKTLSQDERKDCAGLAALINEFIPCINLITFFSANKRLMLSVCFSSLSLSLFPLS